MCLVGFFFDSRVNVKFTILQRKLFKSFCTAWLTLVSWFEILWKISIFKVFLKHRFYLTCLVILLFCHPAKACLFICLQQWFLKYGSRWVAPRSFKSVKTIFCKIRIFKICRIFFFFRFIKSFKINASSAFSRLYRNRIKLLHRK